MHTKARWQLLRTKCLLSGRSLVWLFSHLRYSVFALLGAVGFFELVYWMLKPTVFWVLMTSSHLSISDKLQQLIGPFSYTYIQNGFVITAIMLSLALAQGLSLAAVIYVLRHQPKLDEALLGEGVLVSFIALIGLGCPACGTSLITPIVAMFVSGSATAVSQVIARIILPIALLISLYGLYVLGLRVATIRVHNDDVVMRGNSFADRIKQKLADNKSDI